MRVILYSIHSKNFWTIIKYNTFKQIEITHYPRDRNIRSKIKKYRSIIHNEEWKIIIKSTNPEDFPSNCQKIISFKGVFSRCHSKCKKIQFLSWLGSKGLTSFEDYLLPTGFPVCVSIHFSFLGIVPPLCMGSSFFQSDRTAA